VYRLACKRASSTAFGADPRGPRPLTAVDLVVRAAERAGVDGVVDVREQREHRLQVHVDGGEVGVELLQRRRLTLRVLVVPARQAHLLFNLIH